VTATVESIPLIASSIMSKKLAEGIDALVLDVKTGNGAFMTDPVLARELATTMIRIGKAHGKRVVALMTAMDRPLGIAIGNALEVVECIDALRGGGPPDLRRVTVALAAEMLVLGGAASDLEKGAALAGAALDDGRALDRFREIVKAQDGDVRVIDDPGLLPTAPVRQEVVSDRQGVVSRIDVRAIGHAAVSLGAGRSSIDSRIDPAVGFHVVVKPGDQVTVGQPLGMVFARDQDQAAAAADELASALSVGREPADPLPLIGERIE